MDGVEKSERNHYRLGHKGGPRSDDYHHLINIRKEIEQPPWVIMEGKVKDWYDLSTDELIEAVNNSDPQTFGDNGVDPHKILSIIRGNSRLSKQAKEELSKQVQEKSEKKPSRITPTSVEWLKG